MITLLVALVAAVVVVGLTVGTLFTVRRQQRSFAAANEVVPGVPTSAPASWAGSHDPEARLHRRLRDAMAALRAGPAAMDGAALDLRVELEQQALALDEALVAAAALPAARRIEPLHRLTEAVERLEAAVADVGAAAADEAMARLDAALDEARQDRVTLAEIRAELDRPSSLPHLDATAPPAPEPTPPPTADPPPEPRPGP